jgi:16S rRNA (guanine1207-N2)-methyltransferase
MTGDPAFATLDLAFARHAFAPGASAIVFDAEVAPILSRWPAPVCIQPWKPAHDRLAAAGVPVRPVPDEDDFGFAIALVRLGRNRIVNRALIAIGARRLADDGTLIVGGENRFGPASHARELGVGNAFVKNKARVFWLTARQARAVPSLDTWCSAIALQACAGHPYRTAPGLFAWDRIDPGSALLARHLPTEIHGRVADLGAGWGYLAIETLRVGAGVTALDLYEADWHALAAARTNVVAAQAAPCPFGGATLGFHWHDVTGGLPRGGYDWIVTNPPFHDPRDADPKLGRRFIRVAADALAGGGRLLVVANRSLPYESVLAERFRRVTKVVECDGYKVLCATRG